MRADRILSLATLILLPLTAAVAIAQEVASDSVDVPVNTSRHVRVGKSISRVSVGSPAIADVAAFPPDQLLITGLRVGETSATVWVGGEVKVIQIVVGFDTVRMTKVLSDSIPDGENLKVTTAGNSLVLSGSVSDATDVEKAERLVLGFAYAAAAGGAPPEVINTLVVRGDYQVQLEVSFAEVSRTGLRQIGLNFWHKAKDGDYSAAILNPSSSATGIVPDLGGAAGGALQNDGGLPIIATPLGSAFGLVFSTATGGFPFSAALNVLSQRGYARTLSEPTLVAMSGETASFLAGGEFPIVVPQSLGQNTIEFKKFGVQLDFMPTVVGDTIQLRLLATVSDLDSSAGITLASTRIPVIRSRSSATTVRLRDGQSFAIAGLLSDNVRSTVDKIPGLGDIPILGALFRSVSYRREETELLVVVTAHIVRPLSERPPLPGENTTTDPSDLELFLFGSIESQSNDVGDRRSGTRSARAPAGPVGFSR